MTLARFRKEMITAQLDDGVVDAAQRMRDARVGCVIVTRNGRPVGILTDRDIALRVIAEGRDPARTRVAEVATLDPIVAREDEGLETVVARMRKHGIRRLPLVAVEGEVVGIVTADDVISLVGRELGDVCGMLEDSADIGDSR